MPLSNRTDEELMVLYQKGSEAAFCLLYERHSSKIYGFIMNRVRNQERCHDIFQEVFVKIHKSKHLYNKSHPLLPWIFTITKNTIVDESRRLKKTLNHIQIEGLEIAAPDVSSGLGVLKLPKQLGEINQNQKVAIEMRYVEEKTFKDIAAKLNTSEANVRQLISRGIQKLRGIVKDGDKS